MDFIKILKRIVLQKGTINQLEKQPTGWKKIFAKCMSDKELLFRIYKGVLQLNSEKRSYPVIKWAKDLDG